MSQNPEIARLLQVMKDLRHPKTGCPWNRTQTHLSLRRHLLEEAYETLEAIDEQNPTHLREELGDLLLQIVFHAEIADEAKQYNIEDIAKDISDKMVRRHPHVFDQHCELTAEESLKNWDEIKKQEKLAKGEVKPKSVLDSVSKALPALYEADKISKKVAKLGFDWTNPEDVFDKITEEIDEVKECVAINDATHLEEELGDLLFSVVNLCRVYKVNAEVALRSANQKFRNRFAKMEKAIDSEHLSIKNLDASAWNQLWENAKK